MQKRAKIILLASAAALLLAAAVLSFKTARTGERAKIIEKLNSFGYDFRFDDLFLAGDSSLGSIRSMLPEGLDLSEAVSASKSSGFASDIDKTGEIALLLADAGGGNVITVFVLDGEIELCFIQVEGTYEVRPL